MFVNEPRESNFRGWQRTQWLEKAACPNPCCDEENQPHKKQMIELNENGEAYCNKCGTSFRPDTDAIRGDSKL